MLRLFKSSGRPVSPAPSIDKDTHVPTPAAPPRPTGQFSASKIRTLFVLGIAAVLFFIVATNKTPPKTAAQKKQIQDTAAAAQTTGGTTAARNYANDVNLTLKPGPATAPRSYPYAGGQPQAFPTAYAAPAQGAAYPPPPMQSYPQGYPQPPLTPSVPYGTAPAQPQHDPQEEMRAALQADDDKREHESLSAPLIVRSERINRLTLPLTAAVAATVPPAAPSSLQAPQPPAPLLSRASIPPNGPAATPSDDVAGRQSRTPLADQNALNNATGPKYRLFEGTIIETVLLNRLNSSFTGPVTCMVTTDLWSHNREHLIIPQGTKVIGEARRVTHIGQDRLAVVFHRLLMPDGYSVSLDTFTGLNQIGETGLNDKVNHHYVQLFGVSIALGAISAIASRGATSGTLPSSGDTFRQGFSQQLSQESTQILDRFLNVLPTVIIREGVRVKVYLSDDLSLPSYDHHKMLSDL
jgi:type IV secretory pathway VirB10-like protein